MGNVERSTCNLQFNALSIIYLESGAFNSWGYMVTESMTAVIFRGRFYDRVNGIEDRKLDIKD
jgi:hypothetical protein